MTSVNPKTITRYLLSFVFFLRKYKVIAIKTQIEHVILDDMAYRIASTIEPPLKFKAIVNCLSIASNISKIGYKYPGIIQKTIIIAEIVDMIIVLFICFLHKNYGSRSKKGEIPRFELSHNALNRKPQK